MIDQFTFTAVPVMLMMSSIDRWLVFTYPLQYCYRTVKYVVTQIVCAYAFTLFVQAVTIAWIGLYNPAARSVTCAKTNYMPGELYTLLMFIRVSAASLSILFMLSTLVKLRVRVETSAQYRTDAQLRAFMRRQRSFTNAMLFSCAFTFG
uniref:G_PROTEIN_RECEP_F1_2 domain-containing protein n=1 Tax=Ascaris lumbricoides TaxID=6252 RepID=A0A0M3I5J7_ASCLU